MSLVRRVARPLLASVFFATGVDQLRDPKPSPSMDSALAQLAARLPFGEEADPQALVRVNGGVQITAGGLLALGRLPRLSALALAASMVATTLDAHRFWEIDDAAERQQQQIHFLKNASILGGLVIAALDTEGRPGLRWRTRHAADHAKTAARRTRREARLAARAASGTARARAARGLEGAKTAPKKIRKAARRKAAR